ncbi:MAG: 50S ribosomal protein L4 [Deltaproteobacteria bacterium]|uniref:Large ribosomal subunit protein uL4 n=1 Tax=Candidatus Zymogenus saltonus TaxID=2844893 RepID=A0A9D8PNL6_9DELT|nr:50S ribosomal protein L4 [Candidatus Zymogenus saltonus]
MPSVDIYNTNKEVVDKITLKEEIFDTDIKSHLFYDVVKMQQANRRSGTASTKGRAEVSGGGKKPYRQKGTGRARAGSSRSPIWTGGGVIFGPKPRDYSYKVPKKVRRAALKSALTKKLKDNKMIIVDGLDLPEIKTKIIMDILIKLECGSGQTLIVVPERDRNLDLSSRNIKEVKVLPVKGLNVFDVLKYDNIVVTRPAVELIEKALL